VTRWLRSAALSLATACAMAQPQSHAPADDHADARDTAADLHRQAEALEAEGTGAGDDACAHACPLARNVCLLSGRLCAIAARHEGDGELEGLCRDGKDRCERAREKTRRCACSAPE
jgi:hypothetical protein